MKGRCALAVMASFAVTLVTYRPILAEESQPPTTSSVAQPLIVRLSSNEFVGLLTVCRVATLANGSIDVTLATGSGLNLADASDVTLVIDGIKRLEMNGQLRTFRPTSDVLINLDQVTNVWNDSNGFNFWQADSRAWAVPEGVDKTALWKRLQDDSRQGPRGATLLLVTPKLLVNPRHVGHVSMADGKLRFFMSNKSWPIIESPVDIESAKKVLADFARTQ